MKESGGGGGMWRRGEERMADYEMILGAVFRERRAENNQAPAVTRRRSLFFVPHGD